MKKNRMDLSLHNILCRQIPPQSYCIVTSVAASLPKQWLHPIVDRTGVVVNFLPSSFDFSTKGY